MRNWTWRSGLSLLLINLQTLILRKNMINLKKSTLAVLVAATLVSACASTPPQIANKKTYNAPGQELVFGGIFYPDKNQLTITVNDDSIMKGSFPPFTPTRNFQSKYKNISISAHCYFGSVLSSNKGVFGIVAEAVQANKGVSADKCDISVDSKKVETLYFYSL